MPRDDLYDEVSKTFGASLDRLARSYEADPDRRRDLLQEIHLAIWRSLARFREQCSVRTWVYRVGHNVGASWVLKRRRANDRALVGLEDIEDFAVSDRASADHELILKSVYALIHRLRPLDREIILLYLEGLDAASIAEITGLSAGNSATKIHRIKKILSKQYLKGARNGRRERR